MTKRTVCSLSLCLGLALALLCVLGGQSSAARAEPATLYVAPSGDCGGATPCYATVQAAVDAATTGDEIRVATGTYSDVNTRGDVKQVLYIDKTVTIRGGYATSNWDVSDPAAHASILDAQGRGRGLYISGQIAPTVEALHITGGDASGMGPFSWADQGGGIYIEGTTAVISNCLITGNRADHGGGVNLQDSNATLQASIVTGNTAAKYGGGLYVQSGRPTLAGNTLSSNSACEGGGASLQYSNATVQANAITANTATTYGGGLYVGFSSATLIANTVSGNSATGGGGLHLYWSNATVTGNTVYSNTVGSFGGGLSLEGAAPVVSGNIIHGNSAYFLGGGIYLRHSESTLVNNVVVDNRAKLEEGGGLYIEASNPCLLHTTIARNRAADGSGVYVTGYWWDGVYYPSSVVMTNTIFSDHTVGVMVTAGDAATLDTTLWYGNTPNWAGEGSVESINGLRGMPMFAADGYHLRSISGAIDRGVDAGVTSDIDGEERPTGGGFDLGADEYTGPAVGPALYLPLALRQ